MDELTDKGAFVISLDFELLWGVFDKVDWREKKEYFLNTREAVPKILQLFEKYDVSCTWATVGMLFNESWDDWNENIPDVLPEYKNKSLSAYNYGKAIQSKETEALCFAPDLIKQIKGTPGQEIGTHTYSHFYCLEPGQTIVSFSADLVKSKEIAGKLGVTLKSLVFPRNQYNREYLKVVKKIGLQTVRTNPAVWYWKNTQKDSLQQKIFRTGDAYIGMNNKSYKETPQLLPGLFGQRASRLLRPNSGKNFLDRKRIERIRSEMSTAAKHKEIYHLWWHPHNFGSNPEKNLEDLEFILRHYNTCKEKYAFEALNMNKISERELKKYE